MTHALEHARRDMDRRREPSFSVVIPAHMDGCWLKQALASLVAQTWQGFECILIDSSPTDDVVAVAATFLDRLDLRIERRPDLEGWQRKTNHGVALAKANHFCMLHPDDLWMPERASHVRDWLVRHPDDVMHLHPCWIVDAEGRRLSMLRCPLPAEIDVPSRLFLERLLVQNFISVCAPVLRRDAFLAAGGFDTALWYTGDWDLYLRLGQRGAVRYHSQPLACYRIHAEAMTISGSRDGELFNEQLQKVLSKHIGLLSGRRGRRIGARARASVAVNVALAAALHGGRSVSLKAAFALLRLGPVGVILFLRETRLMERVAPRLRTWYFR